MEDVPANKLLRPPSLPTTTVTQSNSRIPRLRISTPAPHNRVEQVLPVLEVLRSDAMVPTCRAATLYPT